MLAQIPAFFGGFFSNYQCPFQKAIVLNIAFEKNRKITQQKESFRYLFDCLNQELLTLN